MKQAQELRGGSTFKRGDSVYRIIKAERHQSTAGRRASAAEMKFKIRDLFSGKVTQETIEATELMEDIILDKADMQFLYEDDGNYYFMNQDTFEQLSITKDILEDAVNYLKEEMVIQILSYEGRPVGVELPTTVNLEVEYTEPGLRGDTTGKATKPATLETGFEIQVPLFIEIGELLEIDTRTGEYVSRA
ncbi:MAG: elongation factor P [Fusobacteriota bacterium]